jgi:hypothetical protein
MISDALIREVEASRRAIRRDVTALHYQLDLPGRAMDAIGNHPLRWLGGSAAIGFVFAFLSRRSRPKKSSALPANAASTAVPEPSKALTFLGILAGIVRVIVPLVRPALSAFAARRLAEMASKL